jgi:hypothetical protein
MLIARTSGECPGYRAVMPMRAHLVGYIATLALVGPLGALPGTASAGCAPYCDKVTKKIARELNGNGHGAWLATVLDDGGYQGRRHAEITRIPKGHGKRYVGVIHVPAGKAKRAHRALMDHWFAQRQTEFVLPLVTRYDTRGGAGARYKKTARWAKNRLGIGWKVH